MGGDEFIVIVENIEELNCQEEIRHFQKIMSEANKAQSGYVYSTAYGYADSSEIVSDGEIRDVNMVTDWRITACMRIKRHAMMQENS